MSKNKPAPQRQLLKDHRQIGRELDLFSFHEYAPGTVFWHPKGWIIYRTLQEFIRKKTELDGYLEISTPIMIKNQLFKKSGHWEHFGEHNMFNLAVYDEDEVAGDKIPTVKMKLNGKIQYVPEVNYSLKPMNCPESALIFASKTRSYQDLPLKLSDFGVLHRRELSGVLGGLLRVRQFVIDDAHLFVRKDQIQDEILKLLTLTIEIYKSLGFKPKFYLATRPDKAMGDKKTWDEAEKDLTVALHNAGVSFKIKPQDGAFYGPKIDIHIDDSQGRDWQLATIQLDFQIPQKMGLGYINKGGLKEVPIMIHRGIFGSLERFIAILLEHFQGNLPIWLSPIQAIVLPITDKNNDYAQNIHRDLKSHSIRADLDSRSETLQAKIRDATIQKIPFLLIVGAKEEQSKQLTLRTHEGKDIGQMKISEFLKKITSNIDNKS